MKENIKLLTEFSIFLSLFFEKKKTTAFLFIIYLYFFVCRLFSGLIT